MKNNIECIVRSSFNKKGKARQGIPALALLPLLGCGTEETPAETADEAEDQSTSTSCLLYTSPSPRD